MACHRSRFFCFGFFHFAIWVRCKPVGPRRGEGADGSRSLCASSTHARNPDNGTRELRTGSRPVPQYGTRNPRVGSARPAIAIWKSEMCALGRRVLINAQIAVPFVGPHRVCPKNDISETPASKKCSLTVGQSNFETDQMKNGCHFWFSRRPHILCANHIGVGSARLDQRVSAVACWRRQQIV